MKSIIYFWYITNIMKTPLILFLLIPLFSFSQEFKLNYENLEDLEILSVEDEFAKIKKKRDELGVFYKTEVDKKRIAINDKRAKYIKESRRNTVELNDIRAEELKQQNADYLLYLEKSYTDFENSNYNEFISLLTEIAKKENCAVIFDEKKFTEFPNVYLDRQREPLIINNNGGLKYQTEITIRAYFDIFGANQIEGIWRSQNQSLTNNDKYVIIKENIYYNAYIIPRNLSNFFSGSTRYRNQLKAKIEFTSYDNIASIEWILENEKGRVNTVGTIKNKSLIEFNLSEKTLMYKLYPNSPESVKETIQKSEWAGNGSGVIISKSGYIITNQHVIENADDIEVEFIINDEVKKYNAEIVQVDKTNDLAIIKIVDINFDGLDDLPYNFKSRSSDVGTRVYAYGYPMALSLMGKEIKITDGIISSKTGFDGNVTTYQITAPIQAGNSGGPLFDDKGNFIGINSSGLRKDVADNVGYTIKSSYVLNLLDILPKTIDLPKNTKLESLPLTEQFKKISKYVVLVKVK